jgi:prolyl oligopeptidase
MKMKAQFTLPALLMVLFSWSCQPTTQKALQYPETAKVDHMDQYFGTEVADPYRWLEDDLSEETAAWVAAENEVTFAYLNNIPYRKKLVDRLEALLDYERVSAPFVEGDYEYFYKNDGLQNHSVIYRYPKDSEQEPEVFLDPNGFSEDGTIALRGMSFTRDGSLAAYMITEGGSDWRKAIAIDVETKEVIDDSLFNLKFSGLSWYKNEGFYYSSYEQEEAGSQLSAKTQMHRLMYHKLGTPQSSDVLVYGGEENPNRYISGFVTEDQNYLVFTAGQNTSGNQLYVKNLNSPNAKAIQIQDDYMARFSYVHNEGEDFYFQTNIEAPNYRLVKVNLKKPAVWEDVIPETENVLSTGYGGGKFFANYLEDAKTVVKQFNLQGTLDREVELPGIGTAYGFSAKKEDKDLYYTFSSFTYPSTIFKYDIASGKSALYRKPEVDFKPEDYETQQVFYESKDGTKVPMFITHRKGLALDGKNPTLLYGYGGFNSSQRPRFSSSRALWLENGGIYAVANLRGGGEYGEEWHQAGTKMNKQNVFDDFIAAGEYLIKNKYTSSDYLAISGASNGGLLVGATMTQRPDLAKVALPAVGVLDMLRYHTFTAGAGWAADYGTSEESEEMFNYLYQYSPYHALKPGVAYPATLVTTSDHDDRVVPAHSFKFAARLQEYHTGPNPVLIRIQTDAGHGTVSTRQAIELQADVYAFTWYNMGVVPQALP